MSRVSIEGAQYRIDPEHMIHMTIWDPKVFNPYYDS
jgi:hypothetical protein